MMVEAPMKRCLLTVAVLALCLAPLHADLTLVQTMTIEGGFAAMMGGMQPTMTMRIKGNKARADIDVMDQKMTTITDISSKQVTILNSMSKTATVMNAGEMPGMPSGAPMPKIDFSFKPTGQKRTLEGVSCDDYAFTMTLSMSEMAGGGQMPPDAAAALKDVKILMNGVSCVANAGPGAAEYAEFQKAASAQALDWVLKGGAPGGQIQGMDKVLAAAGSAPGIPYLTEITMSFEGSGPMVDMMKQMGAMKMTQKVTKVSIDQLTDDIFTVPADYKIEKK
jgi:hypothetical protein